MSTATSKMKEEIKDKLCDLLRIPNGDENKAILEIIDLITTCAALEAVHLMKTMDRHKIHNQTFRG